MLVRRTLSQTSNQYSPSRRAAVTVDITTSAQPTEAFEVATRWGEPSPAQLEEVNRAQETRLAHEHELDMERLRQASAQSEAQQRAAAEAARRQHQFRMTRMALNYATGFSVAVVVAFLGWHGKLNLDNFVDRVMEERPDAGEDYDYSEDELR